MLKISFEEVKEMLEQLKYANIKEIREGIYSALNPWKEAREFAVMEEGKNLRIISKRDLLGVMVDHKNFQTFEVEFISDNNKFKIYIDDFVIGKDMGKVVDHDNREVLNILYK